MPWLTEKSEPGIEITNAHSALHSSSGADWTNFLFRIQIHNDVSSRRAPTQLENGSTESRLT
jgi:hypothetical protein